MIYRFVWSDGEVIEDWYPTRKSVESVVEGIERTARVMGRKKSRLERVEEFPDGWWGRVQAEEVPERRQLHG